MLSLLVHAAALVALSVWEPLGRGVLTFDRAEAERREGAVKERSEAMLEQQRREREQRRLDRKTSDLLKREEQARKRQRMNEDLRQLENARRELEQVRTAKLDQIRAREKIEIQDGDSAALGAAARKLLDRVEAYQPAGESDKAFREAMRDLAVKINWGANGSTSFFTAEQLRTNAATILDQLAEMERGLDSRPPSEAEALAPIQEQRARVAEVARIVAGRFDLAAYHDVTASHLQRDPPREAAADVPRDPADLYDRAVEEEAEINKIREDIAAAELAAAENLTFAAAMERVVQEDPPRPDLGTRLRDPALKTVGELNAYRALLEQAKDETGRMAVRAEGLASQMKGQGDAESALARRLMNSRAWGRKLANRHDKVVDITAWMRGRGGDGSGGAGDSGGGDADLTPRGSDMASGDGPSGEMTLAAETVYAHALPGRRFGPASARKGWLYIDTWYLIGPWQRQEGPDFPGTFPPQLTLDLDAEYTDGYVVPDKDLDGRLKWQFHQADSLRIQPPVVVGGSVYYAFTDVYFEAEQDMLLAIASDDAAKVWINGMVVWQDQGLSSWQMDEGFRKVFFRKGYNQVLVRLENGPGFCYFSMLICPPKAVNGVKQ